MDFDEIERWWEHFFFRKRLRQPGGKPEPRYLGNCHAVLARVGTFVICCTECHEAHNWREVHVRTVPSGWYQACCKVEDACNRRLKKR